MWRDQRWFAEILGNLDATKFNGTDGPARLRLKDMLARRVAVLNAIMPQQIAATPAGMWGNALATVSVGQTAPRFRLRLQGNTLRVGPMATAINPYAPIWR